MSRYIFGVYVDKGNGEELFAPVTEDYREAAKTSIKAAAEHGFSVTHALTAHGFKVRTMMLEHYPDGEPGQRFNWVIENFKVEEQEHVRES